jgi:toxin ParE1/3/4
VSGWAVTVTGPARSDIAAALAWTRDTFGPAQTDLYRDKITEALKRLRAGPDLPSTSALATIAPGIRRLALRPPARHVLIYRAVEERRILVLRLLHAAMDLPRHLPRE